MKTIINTKEDENSLKLLEVKNSSPHMQRRKSCLKKTGPKLNTNEITVAHTVSFENGQSVQHAYNITAETAVVASQQTDLSMGDVTATTSDSR